uniref:Uncharacterized protein n=1 Tax=Anguilla anguilla TaxID=7936 RepID=A0A0E9THS5_ANGAN
MFHAFTVLIVTLTVPSNQTTSSTIIFCAPCLCT